MIFAGYQCMERIKDPSFRVRTKKKRLIRCLLCGLLLGGPGTRAGYAILQLFDNPQKIKYLLAHENNSSHNKGFP